MFLLSSKSTVFYGLCHPFQGGFLRFPPIKQAWTRYVVVVLALMLAGVGGRLCWWQWGRSSIKMQAAEAIHQRQQLPRLHDADWQNLANTWRIPDEWRYRPMTLQGQWVQQPEATVFLDNRSMQGRNGRIAISLFAPTQGGPWIAVQRGWVGRDPQRLEAVPILPTSSNPFVLIGQWVPAPSMLMTLRETTPTLSTSTSTSTIVANLDLGVWSKQLGHPIAPLSVQQITPPNASEPLQRHWDAWTQDHQKHQAYALQWALMSIGLLGVALWQIRNLAVVGR